LQLKNRRSLKLSPVSTRYEKRFCAVGKALENPTQYLFIFAGKTSNAVILKNSKEYNAVHREVC
jgi:hypothetical protein